MAQAPDHDASNPTHDSIAELVSRVQGGDDYAVADLDRRLRAELLLIVRAQRSDKLAHRIDSQEVVNAALRSFVSGVRAHSLENIDDTAGICGLLMHFAICKLRDRVRTATSEKRDYRRESSQSDGQPSFAAGQQLSPEQCAEASEFFENLPRIFLDVHRSAMRIFELTLEGLSPRDIAQEMELSLRSVQAIMQGMEQACLNYLRSL